MSQTQKLKSLGQDPLRADASPEALWERVRRSKKSIGQLLMDQSCFAGVGNIYRCEILFKAGVHPQVWCQTSVAAAACAWRRVWWGGFGA